MADQSNSHQNYRHYHPYQDLNSPINKLYTLPTSPEFLFHEEAARKRRSWSENLQYYTGCGYLSGAILGGARGTFDGVAAAESGDSFKIRVNRVLNSGGKTGRRWGNSMGALGLIFAGLESGVVHLRGSDDVGSSFVAGLGTGVLYKAAAGARSAAIGGAVGGMAAGLAVVGKQLMKRHVHV